MLDSETKTGILDLPPISDEEGNVTDSFFVHGSNGKARWVTMTDETGLDDDDANEITCATEANRSMMKFMNQHALALGGANANATAAESSSTTTSSDNSETSQQNQQQQKSFSTALSSSSSSKPKSETTTTSSASSSNKNKTPDQLWVQKYGATKFSDLLSDERINLEILQWLMAWKKKIAASAAAKASSSSSNNTKNSQKAQKQNIDNSNTSLENIVLISGPPGVGKSTLAHVVAKHCGFDVIEVNASYSRSAVEMKQLIGTATADSVVSSSSATTSSSNNQNTQQQQQQQNNSTTNNAASDKLLLPKCLILDEIDGSTNNVIRILLSTNIKRPVLCLANNLYAPALRELRQQVSFVRQIPPLMPQRIASRLEAIAEMEKLTIDRHSLMDLSLHCGGDIRQCLNTLFFVSRQIPQKSFSTGAASKLLRLLRVREPTVSIWSMWETALERKEKNKYVQNIVSAGMMTKEDASRTKLDVGALWASRCAQRCPEIDTVLNGLQEWYSQLPYPDYSFNSTAAVSETFAWVDRSDPFSSTFQPICEAATVEVFRACATLNPRPSHIRHAIPREGQQWSGETLRTNELINQFLERSCLVTTHPFFAEDDEQERKKNQHSSSSYNSKSVGGRRGEQSDDEEEEINFKTSLESLLGKDSSASPSENKHSKSKNNINNNKEGKEGKGKGEKDYHSVVKTYVTTSTAAQDVLPFFCRVVSRVPYGLKLAPGVTQLSSVRNMKDAEILKRLVEVLSESGISFVHDTSSVSTQQSEKQQQYKQQQQQQQQHHQYQYQNQQQQQNLGEWRMTPDWENWAKWSRDKIQTQNFFQQRQKGSIDVGIVRAAAAGLKTNTASNNRSVWERNTKPMPREVKELLVGEIAKCSHSNLARVGARRQREYEQEQKSNDSTSSLLFNNKNKEEKEEEEEKKKKQQGPITPENDANDVAQTQKEKQKEDVKFAKVKPRIGVGVIARDFFGRPIEPKKPKVEDENAIAEEGKNVEDSQQNTTKSSKVAAAVAASPPSLVKYRFFDGSTNSVRKPATTIDFL